MVDTTGVGPPAPLEPMTKARPRPGWAGAVAAFSLVLLVAGAYLILGLVANDRMPRTTMFDDVPVGGLTRQDTLQIARATAVERLGRPLRLSGPDGWSNTLVPAQAGFTIDTDGAVQEVPAPGWSPAGLWRWLTVPVQVTSAIDIDQRQLSKTVAERTTGLVGAPREPAIRTTRGDLTLEPGVTGWTVDTALTSQGVVAAFRSGDQGLAVQAQPASPSVSDADAAVALANARELLDRGLSLQRDDVAVEIPRRLLARTLVFAPVDGALQASVDGPRMTDRLIKRFPELQVPPRDAEFRIRAGRPVIVPARDGKTVAADDVANAVATAAASYPGSGVMSVPSVPLAPRLTDDRAAELGISQRLSAFTQEFPYAAYRVQNIGQAARYVNGTLLMPGDTFSMNDTIKERTRANGYTEGFVIGPGGVFREELGGGVSAATTAVWTAAFFAGMEPVHVQAHSIYIPRYAPGLEATVAWGVFDMTFRNTSPNAVFIAASTTSTSMTVEFWGTRQFDKVKAVFGPRRDVVPYPTVTDPSPTCLGQSGSEGFTIDVERRFINDRSVVRTETFTTAYRPSPRVLCS